MECKKSQYSKIVGLFNKVENKLECLYAHVLDFLTSLLFESKVFDPLAKAENKLECFFALVWQFQPSLLFEGKARADP